eukprot:5907695-Pyramimonas_sp.AAC.1
MCRPSPQVGRRSQLGRSTLLREPRACDVAAPVRAAECATWRRSRPAQLGALLVGRGAGPRHPPVLAAGATGTAR